MASHLERNQLQALPVVDYSVLRPQLRTGDLLFGSGNYPISGRIQEATHSIWTHVAIVLQMARIDRVLLLESVMTVGVRVVPLSKYLSDYEEDGKPYDGCLLIARVDGVTLEFATKLVQFGFDELGRPYNREELACIMDPINLPIERVTIRERVYVCSELVQACFQQVGYEFPKHPGGFITPEDIWIDERVSLLGRIL